MSLPKSITEEELNYILEELIEENIENSLYLKTLIMLGAYAGLRISEAINLRLEDINFNDGYIIIKKQKNGNYNEMQEIPDQLLTQLYIHIRTYHQMIKQKNNYLFFSPYYFRRGSLCQNITRQGVAKLIRIITYSLNLNKVFALTKDGRRKHTITFHSFRHYYGQRICDERGVYDASVMLRHKHISSTETYLYSSRKRKRQIVDSIFNDRIQIYEPELQIMH